MYEGLTNLAGAIKNGRADVQIVFAQGFKTKQDWLYFIQSRFGSPPTLENLVPLWEAKDTQSRRRAFQALFIACWVVFPFEKGSFLISLTPNIFEKAKAGLGDLDERISSHLSKKGYSAHQGFNFLNGYKELLIQIEEDDRLFLKAEGHPMSGLKDTIAHGTSWVVKSVTGSGKTANPDLHNLAKVDVDARIITPRAAENYSNHYKQLLKKMNLKGTLITMHRALEAMLNISYEKAKKYETPQKPLISVWIRRFVPINARFRNIQFRRAAMTTIVDTSIHNEDLIELLQQMILFAERDLPDKCEFRKILLAAKEDLKSMMDYLEKDSDKLGGKRFFEEVRLTQESIENGLKVFQHLLISAT